MTAEMTREETIAVLRTMLSRLDASLASGTWTPEAVAVQDLAEEIGGWLNTRPRRWVLPAEPDCAVQDPEGRTWEPTDDPDAPWQSGRIATTWPMVLTRGPLTEVTP